MLFTTYLLYNEPVTYLQLQAIAQRNRLKVIVIKPETK